MGRGRSCRVGVSRPVDCAGRTPSYPYGGLPTLLLSLLLSIVERRSPLVTFSHHCPLITVGRDVNILLRHMGTPPLLRSSPHNDTAVTTEVKEGTLRRDVQAKARFSTLQS